MAASTNQTELTDPDLASRIDRFMHGSELPGFIEHQTLESVGNVSTRLLNRYQTSGADTLGAFLKLGPEARFKLKNYGRKTEADLHAIVARLASDGQNRGLLLEPDTSSPNGCGDSPHLGPPFEVLKAHEKPWTLINPEIWKTWVTKVAPASDRLIADQADILGENWPTTLRSAKIHDYTSSDWDDFASGPRIGRRKKRTIFLAIAHAVYFPPDTPLAAIDEVLKIPALKNLDERERIILDKRLLSPEGKQLTLDEVGTDLRVTRERVRQVEKNILTRIRESGYAATISRLLKDAANDIFARLSGGELFLTDERLEEMSQEFGGTTLLAIYLEGGSLKTWLSSMFLRFDEAWYCGRDEDWRLVDRRLSSWRPEQFPLPESVVAGTSNVTVREARAYFVCSGRALPFEGYFLPSAHIMLRRAARLHAFIEAEGWAGKDPAVAASKFCEVSGMDEAHHSAGYRAILGAPTLFLASSAAAFPLHRAAPWRMLRVEQTDYPQKEPELSAAEARIADVVRQHGPANLGAITDFCSRDLRVTVATTSVGPIVSQSPHFVRLAPGLYDLREVANDPARIEKGRSALLAEREIRRYCFAKYAGETPAALYTLWDIQQEMRWAFWGEQALPSDVWSSLLAVSDPSIWPALAEDERRKWYALKAEARWRLKVSWEDDLPEEIPSLRDVLLVCKGACLFGEISWIRANCLLGASQTTERAGHSAIVLGIILGLIAPSGRSRWSLQRPHPEYQREWVTYENLLTNDAETNWTHPAIQSRFTHAALRAASGELGWVETSQISVLRSLSQFAKVRAISLADTLLPPEETSDDDVRI